MHHHESDPLVKRFAAFFAGLFKAAESIEEGETKTPDLQTHLTHTDIRMALQAALKREKEEETGQQGMYYDCYVMDVENEYAIYSENGTIYRRAFTIDAANRVTWSGDATEVQQDTRYIPVANVAKAGTTGSDIPPSEEKGDEPVDKTPVINALIGCAKGTWQEKDRPLLETLEHAVLVRMQEEMEARADVQTPEPEDEEQEQEEPTEAAEPPQTTVTTQAQQPVTLEAITQMVTQAVTAAMDARLETFGQQVSERQERQQLVAQLTPQGWTETELAGMPLPTLKKFASHMTPAGFMGRGLPAFATQGTDDEGPADDPDWT